MKIIPAAMFIKAAIAEMANDPNWARDRERCGKELDEASAAGYVSEPLKEGYYLGLRVAAVLQAQGAKL